MRRRKQAPAVVAPLDDVRAEEAGLVPAEHVERVAAARVEDADRRVIAGCRDPRAVRAEHRAVDDAQAVGDAMLMPEGEELLAGLGVEDPDAPVRAGGCDARAVGANVDADDRMHPRAVRRALVEAQQLLARLNAPHSDGPGGAGARDKPSPVRGERDIGSPVRPALRPWERQHLAGPGRGNVPNSRLVRNLTPA